VHLSFSRNLVFCRKTREFLGVVRASLRYSFICGLRFPCDPVLPAILDAFSVKIHQLTPTSFLEVPKFIWILKTFGCSPSINAFTRFYELVIIPAVVKGEDG
jgi:hypothetical protein